MNQTTQKSSPQNKSSIGCIFCKNVYKRWASLNVHIDKKHKVEALASNWVSCQECGTVRSSLQFLRRHNMMHSKKKQHPNEVEVPPQDKYVPSFKQPGSLRQKPGSGRPTKNKVPVPNKTVLSTNKNGGKIEKIPMLDNTTADKSSYQQETIENVRDFMAQQVLNERPATASSLGAEIDLKSHAMLPRGDSEPRQHCKQDLSTVPIRLCLSLDKTTKRWSLTKDVEKVVFKPKRLSFDNSASADEDCEKLVYESKIRALKRKIYLTVCQIINIQGQLLEPTRDSSCANQTVDVTSRAENMSILEKPKSGLDLNPNEKVFADMAKKEKLEKREPLSLGTRDSPVLKAKPEIKSSTGLPAKKVNLLQKVIHLQSSVKKELPSLNLKATLSNDDTKNGTSPHVNNTGSPVNKKNMLDLQSSINKEFPALKLKATLPHDNSTELQVNKKKLLDHHQNTVHLQPSINKEVTALNSRAILSQNATLPPLNIKRKGDSQDSQQTPEPKRRFLENESCTLPTSKTAESPDIEVLHTFIVQDVPARASTKVKLFNKFQNNNTKDSFFRRDIIPSISDCTTLIADLSTAGESRKFFSVGPAQSLIIEEDEIDLKENPEYFPFEGPYMCEICRVFVKTNREFVRHVRLEHGNEIDDDVLEIMEAHFTIPGFKI